MHPIFFLDCFYNDASHSALNSHKSQLLIVTKYGRISLVNSELNRLLNIIETIGITAYCNIEFMPASINVPACYAVLYESYLLSHTVHTYMYLKLVMLCKICTHLLKNIADNRMSVFRSIQGVFFPGSQILSVYTEMFVVKCVQKRSFHCILFFLKLFNK